MAASRAGRSRAGEGCGRRPLADQQRPRARHGRPARRGPGGAHRRLVAADPGISAGRRPGREQRQRLFTGQPAVRVRGLPFGRRDTTVNLEPEFTPLFDGSTLAGWTAIPRIYGRRYPGGPDVLEVITSCPADYNGNAEAHPAAWTVENGEIVGRQQPPGSGYGGYLRTDQAFGDVELRFEANPDWPADTGVMVRRCRDTWEG